MKLPHCMKCHHEFNKKDIIKFTMKLKKGILVCGQCNTPHDLDGFSQFMIVIWYIIPILSLFNFVPIYIQKHQPYFYEHDHFLILNGMVFLSIIWFFLMLPFIPYFLTFKETNIEKEEK